MTKVDLLVGSDIGLWIAGHVDPSDVGSLISKDAATRTLGNRRGMRVGDEPRGMATVALAAHYPEMLPSDLLNAWSAAYNIHPGFLPFGRGYAPVFWALWAAEPAGASLHVMTEKVDAGPIVERVPVGVLANDTGYSLYMRVLAARKRIFSKWWPRLVAGQLPRGQVPEESGTYHSRAAFLRLRNHPPIHELSEDEVRRLYRALDFPGYPTPKRGLTPDEPVHLGERSKAAPRRPTAEPREGLEFEGSANEPS